MLNSKQKAIVRKKAQIQKATFQIGQNLLHDNAIYDLKNAFNRQEIIKVKVNRQDIYDKQIVREIAHQIEAKIGCDVCGIIGTTIILYKTNPKISEPLFKEQK